MTEYLQKLLKDHGIDLFAPISLSHCRIIRPYKLTCSGFGDITSLTAYMIAVPYLTKCEDRNISAYAVPRDYHGFFSLLFGDILPKLREKYPQYLFEGYADNSPIDERLAAAACGLGILGDNGMLITEKYSSYVFLGEMITNAPTVNSEAKEIKRCEGCGRCRESCPMGEIGECLSSVTQKKGELTEEEKNFILKYGCAWGCDICQEECPHTLSAKNSGSIYTSIPYFIENTLPYLTSEIIENMSDEEFDRRAYSWRKRDTIMRNLELLETEKLGK